MTSVWLREALEAESSVDSEPLDGDRRADVCIVGGGFTGLWTAFELKTRDPSLDVVVIEKSVCGAGGSGANAGFAVSLWFQFQLLESIAGTDEALRLCRASVDTISELGEFSSRHSIGSQWQQRGSIWGATCELQSGHWDTVVDGLKKHQVHLFKPLNRDQITELTGTTAHIAGLLDETTALIHPGFLVRGLRRVVLDLGVKIYEHTPMVALGRTRPPTVRTPYGTITAGKVVLGLYGWSLALPELSAGAMVIFSDAVMTEALPDELDSLGWREGPGLMDSRTFVEGYRTTADGRVFWSKAGGALPYGGRMDPHMNQTTRSIKSMRNVMRAVFPTLADRPILGTWAGPIDRTKNGLPMFGVLPACPDILFGYGYSGAGIVLSRMGSRILASLALESDDEWSNAGLVSAPKRSFPPEPFRYIGARFVRAAIERKDEADHAGRQVGPITNFLLRYKPASYKPT